MGDELEDTAADPTAVALTDDQHAEVGSALDRVQAALDEVAATIARMT